MQFCEPIAGAVILPFVFRLVNETGVTQGGEDKTGYYAGIIVRAFHLGFTPVPDDRGWKGVNVLSRHDYLHPAMGKALGQDWPPTCIINRYIWPRTLLALFRSFTGFPRSCRQSVHFRSSERQRRRLKSNDG
jgi:hypothetical protein